MLLFRKLCLAVSAVALMALLAGLSMGSAALWQPAAVIAAWCLALGLGAVPALRSYQFTAWILAAVVSAMIYPASFLHVGDFDLRNKWLLLLIVQLVMFGMGTQMSLHDFAGVLKAPRGVLVGILCHFSVMPLVGFALTKLFHFEPEIAAGIILIGSCSSGLASNVMAYIAKSNLVLSVTVTAITTLVAPLATPLLMKLLAGTLVEVKFVNMMMEIVKIVIVPIGAALLHDYLKTATPRGQRVVNILTTVGAIYLGFLLSAASPFRHTAAGPTTLMITELSAFFAGALIFGGLYHRGTRRFAKLDSLMPVASMAGIVYFTTVTTAAGRDNLLTIGGLLFLAAALHNAAGYFFGYWLSRGAGLDKNSARSVAFEVGLQNGGMASGLAGGMGKLATVGLAAAIFSPWMNITGSLLANYWKRRPVEENGIVKTDNRASKIAEHSDSPISRLQIFSFSISRFPTLPSVSVSHLSRLLLLSLVANLALAALVYSRHISRQQATMALTPSTRTPSATPGAGVATTQSPTASGANAADVGYVARLRASGMPADLIRDLVYLHVRSRYRDRRRALVPDTTDQYWLGWNQTGAQSASSETRARLRALDKEMAAEIRALLGDGPDALGTYERRLYDQMASYLPATKVQQVEAIRRDYDEMAGQIRGQGKGLVLKADREQLRLLEKERRRDLEAVLSPEELMEYDLRASPTANGVRNRLAFFEPSEEEYRALTMLQLEFDRQYGLSNLSGAEQDRRKAAEKDLTAQIQSVLSPERFNDYRVMIDGMFSETRYFTSAYNLDQSVAKEIVALKQRTWKRIDELDQTGINAEQRSAALKALELEVETQLTTRLGAEIFDKYQKSGAGWMQRLKSTPPKS